MPTIESIQADIDEAVTPGFRARLIARGQARAMIWRDGVLPAGAPAFSPQLSYDLHSYGYSLLELGLRLRELGGDSARARIAFEQAATALEAVMAKGVPGESDRDFHFVMAAAAYHLAHLSARAYSLLTIVRAEENFSPIERALGHLMLRDLGALKTTVLDFRLQGTASDAAITAAFQAQWDQAEAAAQPPDGASSFLFDGVDLALIDSFFGALATFLLALERGDRPLMEQALTRLGDGLNICAEINLLPQWWAHRIARHLLSDLWGSTFHERLPLAPAGGDAVAWPSLRELFVASLLRRPKAEIDLWPSQIAAATRAADQSDDLVISLPTSAGKTRISELCILRCLAAGRRVIFITPLRALSAQTEATLQRTFGPLGKTISALYGSIGVSGFDEDAIRERHIVVATPEKLDFALRNDPSLLDDVGLLVFDEGHMIGLSEREVRYEVQIQRLLRRTDAGGRRIVCLSAILPDGNQLEDFAAWLRRDQPGGLVKDDWRPTRLRYGEVVWNGQNARLNLRVDQEQPFVPRFLTGFVPPVGKRKKLFPSDLGELCLAAAWRLVSDGQSVLVFCPVRAHVEPFADRIIDLHRRGALASLLQVDQAVLNTALTLGAEWLGGDHPILECLRLGVAIHHGALPTAFRKEVERLLRDNVLKVTISSPTLAQGLNLSATTVIIHSLFRNRERIATSEFKNVVGRAGRAYVDVEGLVLYPIFDEVAKRTAQWEALIADLSSREMESGLLRLVVTLLVRMQKRVGGSLDNLVDYVVNNAEAWTFPEIVGESAEDRLRAQSDWNNYLATLDTAILSLIGESDIPEADIPAALDDILQSSLWERRLNRRNHERKAAIRAGLVSRSRHIWAQSTAIRRRGYFLAGIGLATGHALDAMAVEGNDLLIQANGSLLNGNAQGAIAAITALAERVFSISPFIPDKLPNNWREVLRLWLLGQPLAAVTAGQEAETLQFVEGGLVYRLPWAMEAIRVRGLANGDAVGDLGFHLDDFELGLAVSAVETGTFQRPASILIQAGFSSRLAAIKAVNDTFATFSNAGELQQWLASDIVRALSELPDWPTAETRSMWTSFLTSFAPQQSKIWKDHRYWAQVEWIGPPVTAGTPLQLYHLPGRPAVLSADGALIGHVDIPLNPSRSGLLRAVAGVEQGKLDLSYLGPDDLWV
ncbi:MAG: DEAD/DEAH box helicase [Mesorhizobium sp.]|uniref:DEAD/DEAH box helicase n=1 Tax=Mesorhizobium sp. M2A.F.Ca.ET.067.02.1.1 TaxID=2496749 RepID=UPI000FD217C5|nr:DEAD/DEAH box helicase [Mesorhizobium sp. M2A.F.Ca.ET.067.02.1.1]RUW80464.1 DEAD/DEAH box helicase [Mesorhizobium sp. M2A.F.Ca.ET.067.02.1.1]TIV41616.1 MAG: DEAD/DEAH box helicase [Mesorhizobium sp.]